jgi:UDP-N-acetylmuramoylalanine--D-glutamate ligase
MGQTKDKIKEATLKEFGNREGAELPIFECASLEEVIAVAKREATEGDIIFFSPASASFDMFRNFEERGNKFKEIVNGL